jgi:hypothetical protein
MGDPTLEELFEQARQARELMQSDSSAYTLKVLDTHWGGCEHPRTWTDEKEGDIVCVMCGLVLSEKIISNKEYYGDVYNITKKSFYKRIHHFNERIQQWQCAEPPVPSEVVAQVKDIVSSMNGPINKTKIRAALRTIKMPKYIERWLQIYCRITDHRVPVIPPQAVDAMREMFILWEAAFRAVRPEGRTCIINYNYLFTRMLQFLHMPEHYKYFPTLKSRSKVKVLDEIWGHMCRQLGTPFVPLPACKTLR